MFIKEVILIVSNLKKSTEFYSAIFGDAVNKSRSRVEFSSGVTLCSEKYWRNKIGLSDDYAYDFSLSSTVVIDCEEFFNTIVSILENGYIQHIINVDNNSVTLTDDDFNVLIIRRNGKGHDFDDDYQAGMKMREVLSLHS